MCTSAGPDTVQYSASNSISAMGNPLLFACCGHASAGAARRSSPSAQAFLPICENPTRGLRDD
jgi:hypothetical protein